jgi:hypothetical protein
MALDTKIVGTSSGNGAEVNASNQMKVVPETDAATNPDNVGAVKIFSENDPGAISGDAYLKSPETSDDYRLRVGIDTIFFTETFNATAQNTGVWKHAFTTMTMTQSTGFLNVNAAGTSTVSGNYAFLQTWKYFPVLGTAPLSVEITANLSSTALQANEIYQFGLGLALAAADPVDGAWYELTNAGLYGVVRYNSGTAAKLLLTATPRTLGKNNKFAMVVSEREVEFWVDDVFYGELTTPAAQSQPFLNAALPVFVEKYNSGTVGSSPSSILKVGDITVSLMDIAISKPWAHQMAGQGYAGQGQNGGTMGANTFFANSAYPTTALPVNTALTANLPTGLTGGRGLATLWNTAATDMVMTQATNPLGGVNQTPRTLFITGIKISAVSFSAALTAPAAGQHALAWGIYWGSTAVTLAQTESASFATGTTKAFRRKFLGVMGWSSGTAPIGTPADKDVVITFEVPVVVHPGENVGLFCQMLNGAATATGGILFTYDFDHYYQ